MSTADYYKPGDYNAVCYECGRKKKAGNLRQSWKGYYLCPEHWEPRHPQDFVYGIPEQTPVPWAQPPSDVFVPSGVPDFLPFDPTIPPEE
jgi:hypothetical protein